MADPRLTVVGSGGADAPPTAAFFFDLGSAEAWLAAERVLQTLPYAAEWIPVLARELPGAETGDDLRCAEEGRARREAIEQAAADRELLPVRWPQPYPFDSEAAMLAATYAKGIGRTVPFALAAFRQAFAGGRVLDEDTILLAGAACEMHPAATLKGARLSGTRRRLDEATAMARERGVRDVPAVWVPDGRVAHGDAGLDEAAGWRPA